MQVAEHHLPRLLLPLLLHRVSRQSTVFSPMTVVRGACSIAILAGHYRITLQLLMLHVAAAFERTSFFKGFRCFRRWKTYHGLAG